MSIKVDGKIFTNKTTQSSRSKKSKKSQSVTESALVCLSEISDAIKAETNTQEGPFDEVKVQEIKNAISEGKFVINTGAIADGILNMAADLIARK